MIDDCDDAHGPQRPVSPEVALENLFQGCSAAEWRLAYACAFDWGLEVGRENVDT